MKSNPKVLPHRRWFFRLVAVLLGLIPFIVLELSLRFATVPQTKVYDDPLVDLHQLRPLFVPKSPPEDVQSDGTSAPELTANAVTLEIPESRLNYFRPAAFPLKKAPDERRIFVLGGSTVQGRPFSTETSFSTWLQLALRAGEPETQWTCINCGGISYASYRISTILDEVLNYSPDLIILYTGHNEFLEDRSYGTWQPLSRGFTKALTPLTQLATVRWISEAFRPATSTVDPTQTDRWTATTEVQARLDQFGGLDAYTRDQEWHKQVIEHFRITLQRMIAACESREIPLLICVPVSDVFDTPPFKIQSDPNLTPQQQSQLEQAWQSASSPENSPSQRLEAAKTILAIDPHHPGAAYVGGRMLFDLGRTSEAKEWLVLARDSDVCPLRAPSEIEGIVRQAIDQNATPYVDVSRQCEQISGNGIVGRSLLIDHVHPTIETHQKIAKWILQEMANHELTSPNSNWESKCDRAFEDHLKTLNEAYFARGFQRLEGLRKWAAGRAGEMSVP